MKKSDNSLEDALPLDAPTQVERNFQLESLYKQVLPKLGTHSGKMIAAYILLILKLEGVIGKDLTDEHIEMIEDLKQQMTSNQSVCKDTLKTIELLMGGKNV